MKSLKLFVAIFSLSILATTSINANNSNTEPTKEKNPLRTEIINLIGNEIPIDIKKTINTEISFTFNNNNELIVIDVDSKNEQLISYIKSKLNYKKINMKNVKKKEVYTLPLRVNKHSK